MSQTKIMFEFGKLIQDMTKWLEHDPKLDLVDQLFIENHLQVVRMAYAGWKSRHIKQNESRRGVLTNHQSEDASDPCDE
ncbi:MAG TPA: hypothetical protein VKB33_00165 [Nitrospira sp.]|nr:hypothetical protein [Nitrospira sp.]